MLRLSRDDQSMRPVDRVARRVRAIVRRGRLALPLPVPSDLRVSYGHDVVPGPGDPARGGTAKAQRLAEHFPSRPSDFTLLYLGSSWLPRDLEAQLAAARRRGAPVVVNQNGVAYPAWAGDDTDRLNERHRLALGASAHVLYQSAFSKDACDRFVGPPAGTWEILPNAVDVDAFTPPATLPTGDPIVVLGGDQHQPYKLEVGLRAFAALREELPGARLVVTGRLAVAADPLLEELGIRDRVEITGRYAQRDLCAILHRAHVYLHPQVMDNCPSAVIEAMASGVPVVYALSGGTPELVGDEAGVGVEHPWSFEVRTPPAPEALAEGVLAALRDRDRLAAGARRRAVERYALRPWIERHRVLFAELRARRAASPAR